MKKLNTVLLLMLLSAVANTWGTCVSGTWSVIAGDRLSCYFGESCGWTPSCKDILSDCDINRCPETKIFSGQYYAGRKIGDVQDCVKGSGSDCGAFGGYPKCTYEYRCDNQREADSTICVLDGNIWKDGTCKVNHCKAADSTWLSTSIAACTGSNNYAIVNTDSTCEHVGTCCPNDSIPSGNTCKWRCDSVLTTCEGRVGTLFGAVLPDTSISGQDTTFSYQCFYNCAHAPNTDSTVYLVEGNVVLSGPSDSISDGIKSETFNSFRTTSGGLYIYDYLSPAASEYVDSIAAMKCVEHLWRCVINNKYVYWYDNQEVPVGCTNIVRVK